ncbi:MAG TPA: DUF1254 domain-containing protein [Rhizomicrobium sp.]|jgi:uncharacterized membrane protein|nr:DUF1254 domain-containing protein [Rhizomicrobium sp.]
MFGRIFGFLLGAIVIGAAVHVASVYFLPQAIMMWTIHKIGSEGMNTMRFGKRPDETARAIVRPSPDLLYSTCAYDLSTGPVAVHAPVPDNTYWSVSLFDDKTNNFYVANDRQMHAEKKTVMDLLVVPAGAHSGTKDMPAVESPSTTGLVLIRTLIDDDRKLAALDAFRRKATCRTWHQP